MKKSLVGFILFFSVLIFFSCNNSDSSAWNEKRINDSLQKAVKSVHLETISNKEGIVGILDIPEIITISKIDSAPMRDVSFKVAKNYSVLEQEMNDIGAVMHGMPGMITYNNDTTNFVFECVLPLIEMPEKQPKTCKLVVLEKAPMLVYNYYGPYQYLFTAYAKIKKYISDNKLQQISQMREFYLSDPIIEKNPAKWQTQIMVPVTSIK